MPFSSTNKQPTYSAEFIDTSKLDQLKKSGCFELQIANATYYQGTSKKTGKAYHQCSLDCAVLYKNKAVRAARFSFLLPSEHMESLCYFLKLYDANGFLSLPDYDHREGTTNSGKTYKIDSFPCLVNKKIFAMLRYTGDNLSNSTGRTYSVFKLEGFCDEHHRSAVEVSNNSEKAEHFKFFLDECKGLNQTEAEIQKAQQAQMSVYGQQTQTPSYQTQMTQAAQSSQPTSQDFANFNDDIPF